MSDRSMSFSPSRSPSPGPRSAAAGKGREEKIRLAAEDREKDFRSPSPPAPSSSRRRSPGPPPQLPRPVAAAAGASGSDHEAEDRSSFLRDSRKRKGREGSAEDRSDEDRGRENRDEERRYVSPPRKTARRSPTPERRGGKASTALVERNPPNTSKRNGDGGGEGGGGSSALARLEAQLTARKDATREAKGEGLRATLAEMNATTRGGGTYIPPARLRALMAEAAAADAGSVEYQRMSWDALKKSITGLVNKVAAENIKMVVPELFGGANLVRGRGLYCRAIMKAQGLSLPYTPVFASLTAIINTKLPQIGELLATRLVSQFRRSFKRNDKTVCNATLIFLAHLVNQRIVTEVLALEILVLLLERPTDDSVELAVAFMREAGQFLSEESPKAINSIFERFRAVLYEGSISKRVQYMVEVLSQVRREKFKDNPKIPEEMDLVEEVDQITHQIGLDDQLNVQESLNVFKVDPNFVENEERYRQIKAEILGEESDSGSGSESGEESDDDDEEDEAGKVQAQLDITDATETNLVNLRRTIYLTIMSAAIYEEAVHKLMKLRIPESQEIELCNMIIECCSQERTYSKFYGHIGERFCKLHRSWSGLFEQSFRNYYDTIHRYETNRLRNIARFFGSLLATDSISWASFEIIHMNEEDTTSSSRIFVKILFQEMNEVLGLKALVERFNAPQMQAYFGNIFPIDNPKNTRFSVNFFTSVGLGALTESMREHLKSVPKILAAQRQAALANRGDDSSDSDSSSDLSTTSSSDISSSSYDSRDSRYSRPRGAGKRRRSYSYSSRSRSYSRSPTPSPRRNRAARDAFSPDRRTGNGGLRSLSRSRSPAPRGGPDRRDRDGAYKDEPRRAPPPPAARAQDDVRRDRSPPEARGGYGREDRYDERGYGGRAYGYDTRDREGFETRRDDDRDRRVR